MRSRHAGLAMEARCALKPLCVNACRANIVSTLMLSLSNRLPSVAPAAGFTELPFGDDAVANDTLSPLQACFGVACLHHHRCARYAAVVDSEASPRTMGTCLTGAAAYPRFVAIRSADAPRR